jgi:predicted AAA+ superfamily ATPase
MNKQTISSKAGVSNATLDTYINALCQLYLFENVPTWPASDYDCAGRLGKLFCTDFGFMASMLGWYQSTVISDPD